MPAIYQCCERSPADGARVFRSIRLTDPELRRLLQQQIDAREIQSGNDFPEQVHSILRAALLTGNAKVDQVAALFSIPTRTFHRRLGAFGSGFQELLDETGFEVAKQMLIDSAIGIGEIAALLNYADARSFIRAFRRWSGTTPARRRAAQKELRRTSVALQGRRALSPTAS